MPNQMHVDDLKISQAEKEVVEDILKKLNHEFWIECQLMTSWGKVLVYQVITNE